MNTKIDPSRVQQQLVLAQRNETVDALSKLSGLDTELDPGLVSEQNHADTLNELAIVSVSVSEKPCIRLIFTPSGNNE